MHPDLFFEIVGLVFKRCDCVSIFGCFLPVACNDSSKKAIELLCATEGDTDMLLKGLDGGFTENICQEIGQLASSSFLWEPAMPMGTSSTGSRILPHRQGMFSSHPGVLESATHVLAERPKGADVTYWLMKSEPDAYSIDDLERDRREPWDGIRNYQARNMIRDEMKVGDRAFFYHSSCKVPSVVGVMKIASAAYPDPTQFDPDADHFDAKSSKDEPRWLLVDVAFERKLNRPITLKELKGHPGLSDFRLNQRGNRLSIFPVSEEHWNLVLGLE
jgi:predicted RNA-binding protein with PUA-like domain